MRFSILAFLLLGAALSTSAQTTYEVSQESAPGEGDFDDNVVGTVTAFDGTSQTVIQYYAEGGSNASYNGPVPAFSDFGTDNINLFLVENSDGLHFYTVLGSISQSNTLYNTTATGPFSAIRVRDENSEHVKSGLTITSDGKIAQNKGDGFAARLFRGSEDAIFFDMNSVTNGLAKPTAGMQALSSDGAGGTAAPLALVLEADRRVRLAPQTLTIGDTNTPVNRAGWRLLSAPVSGLDVLDLARINLVLGVEAGATNAAQFQSAGYVNARGDFAGNLFHEYEGVESIRNAADTADSTAVIYTPVPDADYTFVPGEGIWWYWYDQGLSNAYLQSVYGAGIGDSYNLVDPAFSLAASGPFTSADVSVTFPLATVLPDTYDGDGDDTPDESILQDYFYMGGNPFAQPFNVDGISATNGTVQSVVYAWDPNIDNGDGTFGNHTPLRRSASPEEDGDLAAVWQGFMIEVTPDGLSGPTITYEESSRDQRGDPTFYGLTASTAATPEVAFTLASGEDTVDRTWLRFAPDAEMGWDRHDGSKFGGGRASIALMGERDGTPRRLAMNTIPDGSAYPYARRHDVKMEFSARVPGTYTLAWEDMEMPENWRALFLDRQTGERVKMWKASSYTFSSAETDWSERFIVRLLPAASGASAATSSAALTLAEPRVSEAYPNPATDTARMEVVLAQDQTVHVSVIDALGREVAVLHDGPLAEGSTILALPVETLATGTYLVRVTGTELNETRRITVIR